MKRKVISFYEGLAPQYDEMLNRPKIKAVREYEARRFLEYLDVASHHRVLSMGIGTANDERRMNIQQSVDATVTWIGIDLTFLMLQQARLYKRLDMLVCGDIERMPFAQGVFDRILFHHVLCHIDDYAGVVETAHHLLVQNGLLVFGELVSPDQSSSETAFEMRYPQYREKGLRDTNTSLEAYRTSQQYLSTLVRSGFVIKGLERITTDCSLFVAKRV